LLGSDDSVLDRYLAQATTVQAPLRSWRKLQLYARAFGADKPRLDVAQLPFVPGETWLGLPFGDAPTPEDARSGLLLFSNATTLDPALTWRGILVDHWTEIIPRRKERTSIAFHYDGPRAAAPQAVLVAAPAQNTGTWQFADLQASLEETMDLAKIRAVDAELLPIGQLIPLTLFAFNPLTDITVSTDVSGDLVGAAVGAAVGLV
jgi:hypothetical protein